MTAPWGPGFLSFPSSSKRAPVGRRPIPCEKKRPTNGEFTHHHGDISKIMEICWGISWYHGDMNPPPNSGNALDAHPPSKNMLLGSAIPVLSGCITIVNHSSIPTYVFFFKFRTMVMYTHLKAFLENRATLQSNHPFYGRIFHHYKPSSFWDTSIVQDGAPQI